MVEYFADANVVEKVEVDYELLQKNNDFALRKGLEILASVRTSKVQFFGNDYMRLGVFLVLPKYRKMGVGTIFLHALKEHLDIPIIVDDVVTAAGFSLIRSAAKHKSVFSLKCMDKETGQIGDFRDGDERNHRLAIIFENKITGFFRENTLPGVTDKVYLKFLT